ncbi:IS66 family transposase [Rhodoferax ferrireducens]|uniref:IS66 family transposase n=1 Tax=Rhodoferax ferrireducens TaxID=192843 RepID=UPI003C7AFD58
MIASEQLPHMSADELREAVQSLFKTLTFKQATIDKLTHENAYLKRLKFAAQSERFSAEQRSLLDETLDEDLQAVSDEIEQLASDDKPVRVKEQPKRQPLPAHLPRVDIPHEPDTTTCACGCQMKRIGEDVAEKLDYQPGVFSVERHVRGKWACAKCQTLIQAPVDVHIIDKGIPTTGLLAQVLVAKFADHLPLYRQEAFFGRAGLAIARSTLGAWVGSCGVQLQPLVDALKADILQHSVVHADETPVQMLKPGSGKTHRSYLWAYAAGAFEDTRAVVYDFCESRAGENAKTFLGDWRGSLVCDDFSGYKQLMAQGVTEVGCLAHARRKFFDLHASNKSQIAHSALEQIARVYDIEREVKELLPDERRRIRQEKSKPLLDALHQWMILNRQKITDGSATAKALDYSLRRWSALTRFLSDGQLPVDNNHIENQIRPIAIGRNNWLFAGSLRAGKRGAAVMSLIQSARLNGHDPFAYLKDVLTRLPTQRASQIHELLPHRWQPQIQFT